MPLVDIVVPQLGEGLQEVRILQFLKQTGDPVKRDEPLYEMETDKAAVEVESPCDGRLREWVARAGDILPIGGLIGRIEVEGDVPRPEAVPAPPPQSAIPAVSVPAAAGASGPAARPDREAGDGHSGPLIPPRTRAYCKQLGISEEETRVIPAQTGKLMPEDVDRYRAAKACPSEKGESLIPPTLPTGFRDIPLSSQQRVLLYRLKRSAQLVIPANLSRPVEWHAIRHSVQTWKQLQVEPHPSEFQTFAYCVAQVVRGHPRFRSSLVGEETIREHEHLHLGIAVQRENEDLVLAVVPRADTLDFLSFVGAIQERIRAARDGRDQGTAPAQLHLTFMGPFEIRDAIPVLVAPAAGVLFVGSAYEENQKLVAHLSLTFDHRFINGVAAAQFVKGIAEQVQKVTPEWASPPSPRSGQKS
ncbi:MAG: 2-oxo acid dehydrogenase subunit E2 [Planctomycetes bacterium]|nr:2-oxo acid dehydrogenase subunit E2 [Planctomycetota bacterium]